MSKRRLAINENGEMTYCTASEENIGKGRCNHLTHQGDHENQLDFMERVSDLDIDRLKQERDVKKNNIKPGLTVGAVLTTMITAFGIALNSTSLGDVSVSDVGNSIQDSITKVFNNDVEKEDYKAGKSLPKFTDINKDASYNENGFTPDVQNKIQHVSIESLKPVHYNRAEWSDYTKYYSYTDENGQQVRTESSNRAAYYNSINYDRQKDEYHDPYTNKTFYEYKGTGDKSVNFDHIIPLSYVEQTTGGDWSKNEKTTYASDLSIGVDVQSNINFVKGDKGPSEFMPPSKHGRIRYAYSWLDVANRYNIPIAPEDMKVIEKTLKNAPREDLVPIAQYIEGTQL